MPWWPWESKREAVARERETFERTLCVLREENSTLRRMLEQSNARADTLALDLARAVVVQTPVVTPQLASVPPRRTSRDPIEGLGNVFAPVPFDHADSTFNDARAASLMYAEEESNGTAPAAA